MIPYALALAVFASTLLFARRSLGAGVVSCLVVGYAYGIVRANLLSLPTHLLFDCAVLGLYLGAGPTLVDRITSDARLRPVAAWALALTVWPLLLFFVPAYDPLVQLVGLRGNAFLLPFLVVGASLDTSDRRKIIASLSLLNIAALALAVLEFTTDVRRFFPFNSVTRIIYLSNDVAGYTAFRIPSSFVNAHSYASAMVISLPFLAGALGSKQGSLLEKTLVFAGIASAVAGVFMAATRVHGGVLLVVLAVLTFAGGMGKKGIVAWVVVLSGLAFVVRSDVRLQRFMELSDVDAVGTRVGWSVNDNMIEVISGYPLGNGLAGGGTSVPYFLQDGASSAPVENEYVRVAVEEGTVGLVLWMGFILWFLTRIPLSRREPDFLGRITAWVAVSAYWAVALIGTGLLTSIPFTSVMLMLTGWVGTPTGRESAEPSIEERTYLRAGWKGRRTAGMST